MTEYQLIINPFAEQDISDAKNWYDIQKEDLGTEFTEFLDRTLIRIKKNPEHFPVVYKKIRKAIINKFPYSVFFFVDENVINVFAVFYFYRNPINWKRRHKKL